MAQNWESGQRVVTRDGRVVTVAYVSPRGTVFAWVPGRGEPVVVRPVCDAWGGEHDGDVRNAA